MPLTVPNTFASGQTASAADVNANFDAVESYVNGGVPVADLADGSAGQLIIANASGVPTYRTLTGPVVISNTGATSLTQHYALDAASTNVPAASGWVSVNSLQFTPAAGVWMISAKFIIFGGGAVGRNGRLLYGAGVEDQASAAAETATLTLMARVTTNGTDGIDVQADADLDSTVQYGRVLAHRVT